MRRILRVVFRVLVRFRQAYWLLYRFDKAPYGVVLVDIENHRLVMLNKCFVKGMGYSSRILKTYLFEELGAPGSQEAMVKIFSKVRHGNRVVNKEIEMETARGHRLARWEFELLGDKIWGRCYFL